MHVYMPENPYYKAKKLLAEFDEDVDLHFDGEIFKACKVQIDVVQDFFRIFK